jgi:hypothetical protein
VQKPEPMKKMVRCKLCGYVMEESQLGDVCPACGVASKVFEPYTDPVEPERRRILALDIHPVIVHAPQALAFVLLALIPLTRVVPAAWVDYLVKTITVLGILLPCTVAGAYASGLLDGKTRFRKLKTPLLVQKMVGGAIFFLVSLIMAFLILSTAWLRGAPFVGLCGLAVLSFGCTMWLGMIGVRLMPAIFIKLGRPPKPPAADRPAGPGA